MRGCGGRGRAPSILGDAEREAAASLVSEGDTVQWADRAWRRELAEWMHPARAGDGLKVPGLALPAAQAIVRTFDMGGGIAARDRDLTHGSPLLAALVTGADTVRDWLVAGQALQRVLLTGVLAGVQASFLNQPMQVARIRPRFAQAIGTGATPQLLLRMGHPDGTGSHAPRRPLADVIAG